MKKKILLFTSSFAVLTVCFVVNFKNEVKARPSGIAGYDGRTSSCNACHDGISKTVTNSGMSLLTSDIPSSGYIPGTVYNMTLTVTTKKSNVGFDVSARNANGTIVGTMAAGTNSKVLSSEVVHNGTNNVSGGKKVITFKWTAPAKGTGNVTYYGSILTGINNDVSADTLNKINVVFKEGTVTAIDDAALESSNLSVYPTVANEEFTVAANLTNVSELSVKLYNTQGLLVKNIFDGSANGDFQKSVSCSDLTEGNYVVHFEMNGRKHSQKVIISRR